MTAFPHDPERSCATHSCGLHGMIVHMGALHEIADALNLREWVVAT